MTAKAWVFDVDGCLLDSLTGSSLRPGAGQVLEHLGRAGNRVILWSAGGADYAAARAEEQGVGHLFHEFHAKLERDADGRYVPGFITDLALAVFVDDRPEDMPVGADVIGVSPYLTDNPHDRGLAHVTLRLGISVSDSTDWPK